MSEYRKMLKEEIDMIDEELEKINVRMDTELDDDKIRFLKESKSIWDAKRAYNRHIIKKAGEKSIIFREKRRLMLK